MVCDECHAYQCSKINERNNCNNCNNCNDCNDCNESFCDVMLLRSGVGCGDRREYGCDSNKLPVRT